ncbi:MAG: rhomboid family intramembrane serine protease [Candidatus Bathyarchaeia archaeon]
MSKSSRQYMPTYVFIAANVAVYAFTSILSGSLATNDDVVGALGQINTNVWNGEVWRLFTAIFVHADILHIFGNMFFLLIFGLRAEDMFDIKEYLLIYFLSGLSGGLLTLALWPPETLSIGASGAIFGVLGATIIYARHSIGQSIMGALIYAFFFFIINLGTNVNYLAHLGGLATGLLIGYALAASRRYKRVTNEYNYPNSWGKAGYAVETDA